MAVGPVGGAPPISEDSSRRAFLTRTVNSLIGLWVVLAAGLGAVTGVKYLWPTQKTAGSVREEEVSFPLSDLSEGEITRVVVKGKPVGVVLSDGRLHALSLVCTHLGCIVNWQRDQKRFLCPCHASLFDINGTVLGGPAPRPLPTYEVRVSGTRVVVG